ncbi:MAG: hypothetical protein Q8Q89_01815 [bacterium]|nr:hypothetical protein [bacterium]
MVLFREGLIRGAERSFFEAMRQGWASGASTKKDFPFPGAKGYEFNFKHGETKLQLLDYYFVHELSRTSFGTKIIIHFGQPIWMMQYGGWYDKKAILFVKTALMDSYSRDMFRGGRGQASFYNNESYSGLLYTNLGDPLGFENFKGREFVTDGFGKLLGEHNYFGGVMI